MENIEVPHSSIANYVCRSDTYTKRMQEKNNSFFICKTLHAKDIGRENDKTDYKNRQNSQNDGVRTRQFV